MTRTRATNAAASGVTLERRTLKALGQRSDRPALVWLAQWATMLTGTGWLLWLSLGTLWVIPATLAYGMLGFEHDGRRFCVYNTAKGWFASDGLCTHEEELLEDGMVIGTVIECPLHQGRFDVTTGQALSAPVCVNLATYPVKIEDGAVWVEV